MLLITQLSGSVPEGPGPKNAGKYILMLLITLLASVE